jgi:hypothetical protein
MQDRRTSRGERAHYVLIVRVRVQGALARQLVAAVFELTRLHCKAVRTAMDLTSPAGTRVHRLASHVLPSRPGPPRAIRLLPTSAPGAAAGSPSAEEVARHVRLTADELRFYNAHGFLYLPGVVDHDACDVLREEVLEVCALDPKINLTQEQLLSGSARDGDMLRQSAMHTKEQLLYSLRNSPNLIDIASQLVDGQAMLYNGFTAVKGASGGGLFDLHQDNMCAEPMPHIHASLHTTRP